MRNKLLLWVFPLFQIYIQLDVISLRFRVFFTKSLKDDNWMDVQLNSFRSFFAPFLLQLRRSAAQVMSNQLLQVRKGEEENDSDPFHGTSFHYRYFLFLVFYCFTFFVADPSQCVYPVGRCFEWVNPSHPSAIFISLIAVSVVSSIERGSNACTMQLTSIANVWKEVREYSKQRLHKKSERHFFILVPKDR